MSDSCCPYFNQGLFVGSTPAGATQIAMCCWQGKHVTQSVNFDSKYLNDLRLEAKQQLPQVCAKYCDMPGNNANERERSQVEWQQLFSVDYKEKKLTSLHLEQSLTCNLKCISCSSTYSSSWNNEYQVFDSSQPLITVAKNVESQWESLDLSHLKKLHFTGGEPLLNKDNKKILHHLRNIGVLDKVIISYNTNGTVIPDLETLNFWKQARFVRLFVSLDGVGSVFDYTRFPAKWQQVEKNIQSFRSFKDICILIEVNAIVGIHNVFSLPEFFDWWLTHCQTGSQGDPSEIFVREISGWSHGGRVLDLKHLSNGAAQTAIQILESYKKYPGVVDVINYIAANRDPNFQWIQYLDKLDQLRRVNWRSMLSSQIQKDIPC